MEFKNGGFLDPATLQGAALFAIVFAFFACCSVAHYE
jgi:hypothetical protein